MSTIRLKGLSYDPDLELALQEAPRLSYGKAVEIDRWYQEHQHDGMFGWNERTTPDKIMKWSSFIYWPVLSRVERMLAREDKGDAHILFPQELFFELNRKDDGEGTIRWMARHLQLDNVPYSLPGLVPEYCRRFGSMKSPTGYYAMLHVLEGADLRAKHGSLLANLAIQALRVSALPFSSLDEIQRAHEARIAGIDLIAHKS